jgi:hypothetical protein
MASSTSSAALNAAWSAAWADFLSNRVALAERRAAPFVRAALPAALAAASSEDATDDNEGLADELVTLADLAHMAGAAHGDVATLEQALAAYDAHLRLCPSNRAAMRMRAETLLRCRQTARAFAAFRSLYEASLAEEPSEVAAFQLVHDAECVEDAVRLGVDAKALATAAAWRELAAQLRRADLGSSSSGGGGSGGGGAGAGAAGGAGGGGAAGADVDGGDADGGTGDGGADAAVSSAAWTHRHAVASLSSAQRALLGSHGAPLPLPPAALVDGAAELSASSMQALRHDIDWAWAVKEYSEQRAVVIDELLDPTALSSLQAYARHGAHFRTLRKGYLGAFPSDGVTHPLLRALADELVAAAPSIFAPHALALWWLFKYDETNPCGIGIHADPAAVNINLWLTDDAACLDGGGLAIYAHVPALEQPTAHVNHEFEGETAEASLREQLQRAGAVRTIPYKCNRAAIFVSDRTHTASQWNC